MNLVMLPMWIFSGVFFSSERFPEAVQPLINAAAADRPEPSCFAASCWKANRWSPSGRKSPFCWLRGGDVCVALGFSAGVRQAAENSYVRCSRCDIGRPQAS